MLKILLIETRLTGHHKVYLESLVNSAGSLGEVRVVVPTREPIRGISEESALSVKDSSVTGNSPSSGTSDDDLYVLPFETNDLKHYLSWVKGIKKICNEWNPDLVHIVYGDEFYRFFGIGLSSLAKKYKLVFTCHQLHHSRGRDLSYRRISKAVDAMVVHTEHLSEDLKGLGIRNGVHIEYPHFGTVEQKDTMESRKMLGIPADETPLLLSLGGTRYDKGLDILLNALKKVEVPFYLLIAGQEGHFSEEFIDEQSAAYRGRVFKKLKFLTEEEFQLCLSASSIVVLPYRKVFDGASGPLGDGAAFGKMIIGSDHGSLGELIIKNHLGSVFAAEQEDSLAEVLSKALNGAWKPDETYRSYQKMMLPERFEEDYQELFLNLLG